MRNKLTGILLLICLLAPVIGIYGWLQHKRYVVKKEVKRQIIAGMDREELVLLKFTGEEIETLLKWEDDEEFEYQGQMYDVVEVIEKDGMIHYWCWKDDEETLLNRDLNRLLAGALGSHPQNNEHQKQIQNFFKTLYCLDHFSWSPPIEFTAKGNTIYLLQHVTAGYPPPVPPPKSA